MSQVLRAHIIDLLIRHRLPLSDEKQLQAEMDKFAIQDMSKWNRLAQAQGVFTGTGQQGSQTQTSVSQPTDWWSKILGGGLLASQAL